MNKPFSASFAILCVLFSVLLIGLALDVPTVKASETIYIRSNGSVDPPTAPISSVDNVTYTFNDIIGESIVVERSNIIIDGAGYLVEGPGSGYGFTLYNVSNVTIKKANINNFYHGIFLNSTSGSSILENYVTANIYDGIRLERSSGNTISGNNATDNGNDGIKIAYDSNNNIVSENEMTENNADGIELYSSLNNSISENKIEANSADGILMHYNTSNNEVYGNEITNNRYGIEVLSHSEDNSITGNNITINSLSGIYLEYSSRNNIQGNTVANNYEGIVILGSLNNTISENNITANDSYGVWLDAYAQNNKISGNNISANTDMGIYLRYSSNNEVFGNEVRDNYNGIWISGSSYTDISENTVRDNYNGIVLVLGSLNARLYHNNFINNTQQASSASANSWDNGLEGNYWSDYPGVDLNKDGIGDSPNIIDANNVDNFPLIGIFSSFDAQWGYKVNVISNSTVDDFEFSKSPANIVIMMHVSNMTLNQTSGFCRVTIPHALMTEPYSVTVDGAEPNYANYTLHDNNISRWIYFSYNHSTLEIIIQGTDITPPTISIISPQNITYTTENVPLSFTVDEATSWIGYSLNGEANVTVGGNVTLEGLPDGVHSLVVFANDTAGNMGTSSAVPFVVDTSPPNITILSPENTTYATTSVSLTFVVDEVTSWIGYSLNGEANVTIGGNVTLEGLPDGVHSLVVFANDTVGNMGTSGAVPFVVDTIPPNIAIVSPKNRTYTTPSVSLNFTVDEAVSWVGYSLDGEANVTMEGNTTLLDLSEGVHSIIVFANDTVGNMGNSTLIYFTVDAVSPNIVILSPVNTTYGANVSLTFVIDEVTSWIGYSLNGEANVTISGSTTLTELPEGSHTILIYANDTVGNMGYSDTVYFTVDATPPNITEVSQTPPEDNVLPEDEVKVNATVFDELSPLKQVFLNYTTGNGTWFIINMTNPEGDIWSATIPPFPYGTNITYIISAEDNGGNTITSEELAYEYQYQVIPEFPLLLILPLFMAATLLAALLHKRKHSIRTQKGLTSNR